MITVQKLIEMLIELPPNAVVWSAGSEGVFPAEKGNLFPLKVYADDDAIGLYIDDGICSYSKIVDNWVSLNEWVDKKKLSKH